MAWIGFHIRPIQIVWSRACGDRSMAKHAVGRIAQSGSELQRIGDMEVKLPESALGLMLVEANDIRIGAGAARHRVGSGNRAVQRHSSADVFKALRTGRTGIDEGSPSHVRLV